MKFAVNCDQLTLYALEPGDYFGNSFENMSWIDPRHLTPFSTNVFEYCLCFRFFFFVLSSALSRFTRLNSRVGEHVFGEFEVSDTGVGFRQ